MWLWRVFHFLKKNIDSRKIDYQGYDINPNLIKFCKKKYITNNSRFFNLSCPIHFVDYSIMSGTFNLCVIDDLIFWEKYIIDNLTKIWKKTKQAMLFNLLINHNRIISNHLYYSEKNWIKKICEQKFNKVITIQDICLPEDLLVVIYR